MDFEKKNRAYKSVMLVIVTALITFLITAIGMYNYVTKTDAGITKVVTSSEPTKLDTKLILIRKYLEENYLGDIASDEELTESAIKGYVEGLKDEYTEYLTKDEYDELMVSVNGNYVGIGIYMTQDRYENIVVLLPIEGSPAAEAGLKTGDIITKVNGEECVGKDLSTISNKIKGEEGTTVELEILRENETFTKTIERRTVQVNPMESEILENNIGYIRLMGFDENCHEEFEKKVDELISKGAKSLIIDLRDNGGGVVDEATDITELFLPKDKTIMIERTKKEGEQITKSEKDAKYNMKVVILTNENSASASEIFVGAMKDNGVAKIVGTKTYGKGVIQQILTVKDGSGIKLTVEEYQTPNRNKINKIGIEPNETVELPSDVESVLNVPEDKDTQLQKAQEIANKNQ